MSNRRPRRVALAVTAFLLLLASGCAPPPSLAELDVHLYRRSLPSFVGWWERQQAAAQHVSVATVDRWWRREPERLDAPGARSGRWDASTDFCSFAPDHGPGFDFRPACVRHDFAWRNLRRIDRQAGGRGRVDTPSRRRRANEQFLADMRLLCRAGPVLFEPACLVVAASYHRVVSLVT